MELRFYAEKDEKDIENYYISENMQEFSIHPKEVLAMAKEESKFRPVLGYDNGNLVSVFALDTSATLQDYTENPNGIIFRKFTVDSHYLQQGYGSKVLALLPNFVKQHYPNVNEIVLGVNSENRVAQNLYKKFGFEDTGKRPTGSWGTGMILIKPI